MNRFRSLALAACVPLLLLAGCSDGSPTGTASPLVPDAPALSEGSESLDVSQLARFNQPPVVTIAWAKKWIGPEGGRLEFQGFAIDVPAGAVEKVTQFSIHLPVDPKESEHVVARFGPHGATFPVPIIIEVPYAGTSIDGEAGTIVWGNPTTGEWENYGGGTTLDGRRLQTTTTHFSTYGAMGTGLVASGG